MAKSDFRTVDDYLAAQPKSVQAILTEVCGVIRKALPKAEETISYGIPTYRSARGVVIYFAAWKAHFSLYPASAKLIAAFREDLSSATINKSTLRFPLNAPVPTKLIARIARYRVAEQAERAKAKKSATAKKKTSRGR